MNQVVIVHFFGKFCLETDIGYLDEEKIHSKKLITLLAFFLLNYNRMIPAEELGELMWGNGGSSNPIGALKNLIYRLRNILKQLGTAEYIVSQAGRYGWNNAVMWRNLSIMQNRQENLKAIQTFGSKNTNRHWPAIKSPAPRFLHQNPGLQYGSHIITQCI